MSIIQLLFYNNPTSLEVHGGTKYTPGNGYIYHVFLEPGSFDVTNGPITAEMLLVAGGGTGGQSPSYSTGGGGAGGVQNITSIPVSDGFYPVVVGSGGLSPGTVRSAGSPSSAFGYESIGGGRGNDSPSDITPDNIGGSGGGNTTASPSGSQPLTASGIAGQGNRGGLGNGPSASGAGGGGGGRGAVGSNAGPSPLSPSYSQAGPGGNGSPFPAYAAPLFPDMPADWATAVGANGYYGGGGGGGNANTPTSANLTTASGGLGGGGRGYNWRPSTPPNLVATPSTSGVDYTGGGGGGGTQSNLRSGGTGIVIIRYAV